MKDPNFKWCYKVSRIAFLVVEKNKSRITFIEDEKLKFKEIEKIYRDRLLNIKYKIKIVEFFEK